MHTRTKIKDETDSKSFTNRSNGMGIRQEKQKLERLHPRMD